MFPSLHAQESICQSSLVIHIQLHHWSCKPDNRPLEHNPHSSFGQTVIRGILQLLQKATKVWQGHIKIPPQILGLPDKLSVCECVTFYSEFLAISLSFFCLFCVLTNGRLSSHFICIAPVFSPFPLCTHTHQEFNCPDFQKSLKPIISSKTSEPLRNFSP